MVALVLHLLTTPHRYLPFILPAARELLKPLSFKLQLRASVGKNWAAPARWHGVLIQQNPKTSPQGIYSIYTCGITLFSNHSRLSHRKFCPALKESGPRSSNGCQESLRSCHFLARQPPTGVHSELVQSSDTPYYHTLCHTRYSSGTAPNPGSQSHRRAQSRAASR